MCGTEVHSRFEWRSLAGDWLEALLKNNISFDHFFLNVSKHVAFSIRYRLIFFCKLTKLAYSRGWHKKKNLQFRWRKMRLKKINMHAHVLLISLDICIAHLHFTFYKYFLHFSAIFSTLKKRTQLRHSVNFSWGSWTILKLFMWTWCDEWWRWWILSVTHHASINAHCVGVGCFASFPKSNFVFILRRFLTKQLCFIIRLQKNA